jgi:DNA polymerase III subunit epsilon
MAQFILVVDIETTGFLDEGGKIVEIGIVKLDLENGKILPAFDSLIKEPGFDINHTKEPFGWIFKNSSITYEEVLFAPSLESKRDIIQGLFDECPATAYNKEFDFGFLQNRGFEIHELLCPMWIADPILDLKDDDDGDRYINKWPSMEDVYKYLNCLSASVKLK